MKILVCGGRDFYNWRLLEQELYEIFKGETDNEIIEGGASGADSLARMYGKYNNIRVRTFPANWTKFGRKAGYLRNEQMLREGQPDLVIAFPGGKGTANMIKLAKERTEVKEITNG